MDRLCRSCGGDGLELSILLTLLVSWVGFCLCPETGFSTTYIESRETATYMVNAVPLQFDGRGAAVAVSCYPSFKNLPFAINSLECFDIRSTLTYFT